jgi:hypothetical protein
MSTPFLPVGKDKVVTDECLKLLVVPHKQWSHELARVKRGGGY